MTADETLEQRVERLERLLKEDPRATPLLLTDETWIGAYRPVSKVGTSKGLILTGELKEAGYAEGDNVIVLVLRKGADPFRKNTEME